MTDMRGAAQGLNLVDSVYERLLSERIIFLGSQVDDDIANRLCAQILLLAAEDPTKDIPCTSTRRADRSARAWRSTTPWCWRPCDVATYAMGMAASMGQFLLAAGHQGQALRAAARAHPDAPAAGRRHRQRGRHRDSGRAVRRHQEGDVPAQRRIHRPADRTHRGRLRPRPLVHRAGSPRVRVRRPHHHQRPRQRSVKPS